MSQRNIIDSLLDAGGDLFDRSKFEEALTTFNVALTELKSSKTCNLVQEAEVRTLPVVNREVTHFPKQSRAFRCYPDIFERGQCDHGPRPSTTPVSPGQSGLLPVTEACIFVNTGLCYQSLGCEHEASEFLESALHLAKTCFSPTSKANLLTVWAEIGMRSANNLGCMHYSRGSYDLALVSFDEALCFSMHLGVIENHYQLEHADFLSNRCRVEWVRHNITPSLQVDLQKVMRIRHNLLPWNHPDVAESHFNLGVVEYNLGGVASAFSCFDKYLRCSEAGEEVGDCILDPVPALVYLLLVQHEGNDDSGSVSLVRALKSLIEKRSQFGRCHVEVATALNCAGATLFHRGNFTEALIFFKEELQLEFGFAGNTESVSTSITCNNIGRIFQELGAFHEALEYYTRALRFHYGSIDLFSPLSRADTVDVNDPSANLYSTVWYNLGLIYDRLGKFDEAIFSFERSLNIRRLLHGTEDPDVTCLLFNIGVLQMERHRLFEASECLAEALLLRRVTPKGYLDDSHVLRTLSKLSSLHRSNGDFLAALKVSMSILAVQEASLELNEEDKQYQTVSTLRTISELHLDLGNMEESLATAAESFNQIKWLTRQKCHESGDREAFLEQFLSSGLLLGCLYHELAEPLQGNAVFRTVSLHLNTTLEAQGISCTANLHREITTILVNGHCAPQA